MIAFTLAACNTTVKEKVPALPDANLFKNPGFEEIEDNVPVGWTVGESGVAWGNQVTATPEAARSGEIGVKIIKEASAMSCQVV